MYLDIPCDKKLIVPFTYSYSYSYRQVPFLLTLSIGTIYKTSIQVGTYLINLISMIRIGIPIGYVGHKCLQENYLFVHKLKATRIYAIPIDRYTAPRWKNRATVRFQSTRRREWLYFYRYILVTCRITVIYLTAT